jgi:hypothetical protein
MPFLISRPAPAGKLRGANTVFQSFKEFLAVRTIHQVTGRARTLHSQGARHGNGVSG